ncbi:cytochrome c oxidase subunit II [Leptospira fletcheri]|uniref:Cytochrome c oxidase subunit 2 n=1 Tax=Leptospira fletcheri TaxID=2484981 RepID=A0A4R9GGR6_9LEPT|nr:cytochrome c oxidase subunit II [Leptospira fletcheri]TGK11890.1 cytochrome c oxidase subunit II [Leptospira fletcheri]
MNWYHFITATSFMPVPASAAAAGVDYLYAFLLISGLISFVILIGGMTIFIIRYRRQSETQKSAYITHNTLAEFLWSFIPFVIMMVIFAWGWVVFDDLRKVGVAGDVEVHVTARQWAWSFQYKDGIKVSSPTSDKLNPEIANSTLLKPGIVVLPIGKTVRFILTSDDVLHSFYVPAFRNKMDAVPGRRTTFTFKPIEKGDFTVFCTEYCGTSHSNMMATIRVVDSEQYAAWIGEQKAAAANAGNANPADKGKALYTELGCNSCHSLDGSRIVGPSFKGLYGNKREFADGSTGKGDDEYIKQSILVPTAKIVAGFPPAMPSFQGRVSNEQMTDIIEFIKTLK